MENTQKTLDATGKKAIQTQKRRNAVQKELSEIPEYANHIELKEYATKVKSLRNNAQGSLSSLGKKAIQNDKKRIQGMHRNISHNALKNIVSKAKALTQKRNKTQNNLASNAYIFKMINDEEQKEKRQIQQDEQNNPFIISFNKLKGVYSPPYSPERYQRIKKKINARDKRGSRRLPTVNSSPPLTEDKFERDINKGLQKKEGSQKFLDLIGRSAKLMKENRNDAHRSLKHIGRKAIKTQINRNTAQNELKHKAFLQDFIKKVNGEIADLKKGNGHSLPMNQVDEIIKKYEEMIEIIKAKHDESDERMEESYQDLFDDFLLSKKNYDELYENCSSLQERYDKLIEMVDEDQPHGMYDLKKMVLKRKAGSYHTKRLRDRKDNLLYRKLNSKIKNMTKTIEKLKAL
jgi:hypothetical protein